LRNHLVPLPIAYHPAHVFTRHVGHCRKVALADLVTDHEVPRAVILADMLAELEQGARQARLKLAAATASLSQASGQHVDEVLVELCAADEAQLAISDRKHRRRPRPAIDDGELTVDRAGAEHGQDPLLTPSRGYAAAQNPSVLRVPEVRLGLECFWRMAFKRFRFPPHDRRIWIFALDPVARDRSLRLLFSLT
jgi:hypothetical protein